MLKKLCWQLNYLLTLLEISSPSEAQKVRDFSRLWGGGGGLHNVRANYFQDYFPRRLSLDTVVPFWGLTYF